MEEGIESMNTLGINGYDMILEKRSEQVNTYKK